MYAGWTTKALWKQLLFTQPNRHLWKNVERALNIDRTQARRLMMAKNDFGNSSNIVSRRSALKLLSSQKGKNDDDDDDWRWKS